MWFHKSPVLSPIPIPQSTTGRGQHHLPGVRQEEDHGGDGGEERVAGKEEEERRPHPGNSWSNLATAGHTWQHMVTRVQGRGTIVGIRGVLIPALDLDPESHFKLFGDSGSGLGSRKNRKPNIYRGFMIMGLDPNPESDFQPLCDSKSRFGSSKKWNHNTSRLEIEIKSHGCSKRWSLGCAFDSRNLGINLLSNLGGLAVFDPKLWLNQLNFWVQSCGAVIYLTIIRCTEKRATMTKPKRCKYILCLSCLCKYINVPPVSISGLLLPVKK